LNPVRFHPGLRWFLRASASGSWSQDDRGHADPSSGGACKIGLQDINVKKEVGRAQCKKDEHSSKCKVRE